jgi:hypothetical protein
LNALQGKEVGGEGMLLDNNKNPTKNKRLQSKRSVRKPVFC